MTMSFSHQTLGQRVHFGAGNLIADVRGDVKRLGALEILLIASGSAAAAADELHASLPIAHRIERARQHVPVEDADEARAAAAAARADLILCIGGGSAIGLGKAVALTTHAPIIAVPTTYAGSEATNIWGVTEDGVKITGADDAVLPHSVVYDVELVRDLPTELAIASGMNALAHCIDSCWAPGANPLNRLSAGEAMRALAAGMVQLAEGHAERSEGSQQLQYGAYLAATAFASAGSGLHHKICHVLGGAFGLPHAQTHAVLLPYVLAFNLPAAPEAGERIAQALGAADPVQGLERLRTRTRAPQALRDHGLREKDLSRAAELVFGVVPASNPRAMTLLEAEQLISAAWAGDDPASLSRMMQVSGGARSR